MARFQHPTKRSVDQRRIQGPGFAKLLGGGIAEVWALGAEPIARSRGRALGVGSEAFCPFLTKGAK